MELDAFAQFEVQGHVVDPLVGLGQVRHEVTGLEVAEQQAVPGRVADDDQFTSPVEVGVDDRRFTVGHPGKRIVGLAGKRSTGADAQCNRCDRQALHNLTNHIVLP